MEGIGGALETIFEKRTTEHQLIGKRKDYPRVAKAVRPSIFNRARAPLDCLRSNVLGSYMDAQDRQECRPVPLFKDVVNFGGEGGIRTLGTLVRHTRFPVVHNRPLCHLSGEPAFRVGRASGLTIVST